MISAPSFPVSDTVPAPATARWRRPSTATLVRVGIVLFAAGLRFYDLEGRPPHFDEGVNGWFTDQMQHLGCYQYDPTNYHGPLHFYVLFLFKVLFGRHLWALRLPVVLVGIVTVDWLFRFERFLGRRASAWAALGMALSPGLLYYQRDAIHETWLVLFLILAFWGVFGLWQDGGKRYLWAVAMGVTGMVLTKETYIIHFGCLLLRGAGALACSKDLCPPGVRSWSSRRPPPLRSAEDEAKSSGPTPLPTSRRCVARFAAAIAPQALPRLRT